ncbi:MAG: hypothetical protein P8P49_01945 [Opitutales bacterium]|nr:hypothetical protein [Opitutales bacterium]MDG1324499.1 hypothetical protein [Opitutales bacterium]
MDPITASGVFSIGKELLTKAATSLSTAEPVDGSSFSQKLDGSHNASVITSDPSLRLQNLEGSFKADLLNDPKTASFFQQNQNNKVFLEKRADGSVQFLSSNGQSLVLEANSPHCAKANELLDLCFENKFNLTAMRPNAVAFNS